MPLLPLGRGCGIPTEWRAIPAVIGDQQAGTQSGLANLVTSYRAGAPHVWVDIDRIKAETLKVSIGDVFTTFVNNTGAGDDGGTWLGPVVAGIPLYVMLIGLLNAQYTLTGYDASAHMTEETRDAAVAGPRGIVSAILVSLAAGYWFGGWLVDRSQNLRRLYGCILLAGVYLAGTVPFTSKVAFACLQFPLAVGSLLASLFQPMIAKLNATSVYPAATGIKRYLIAALSLICVAFTLYPPDFGYEEPISVQIYAGDKAAWPVNCAGTTLYAAIVRSTISILAGLR